MNRSHSVRAMEASRATSTRVPVAVLGATGYTGVELLRLLARHPGVELAFLSSEQYRERLVADLLRRGRRVIDLSADFRLRDPGVYARWYGVHPAPELLDEAVYGLPEVYRARLPGARLVAVPGCYPTGALLGLFPLARAGVIRDAVIVDAKSGTTGAGRGAKVEQLFAEVNENFRPYAVGSHRHRPEIEQELRAAGTQAPVVFVPHLLPVSRGILSTMYVRATGGRPPLAELFAEAYEKEPFVVLRG